jgi:hypothetical protein
MAELIKCSCLKIVRLEIQSHKRVGFRVNIVSRVNGDILLADFDDSQERSGNNQQIGNIKIIRPGQRFGNKSLVEVTGFLELCPNLRPEIDSIDQTHEISSALSKSSSRGKFVSCILHTGHHMSKGVPQVHNFEASL